MNFGIRSLFGNKSKDGKEGGPLTGDENPAVEGASSEDAPVEGAAQDEAPPAREVSPAESAPQPSESVEEEQPRRPALRVRPKNSKELFLEAIPERSRFASANLKSHLSGKIEFEIKPSGVRYTVDWSGEELKSSEGSVDEAACTIKISEADLMRIVSGDLNPQVAMLSHRVFISGNPDHAVYAFNLIAPVANI